MCRADYTANRAVQGEILRAFQSLGLPVDWRHAGRRPPPADTLDEQFARIAMSGRAVRLVRQRMRIGHDEQRLIERLADHAMRDRECAGKPAAPKIRPVTDEEFLAYAAAGGGAWGSFAKFRRQFAGDPVVPAAPEPEAAPPEAPVAAPAPRPAPRPAQARRQRQPQAPPAPTVPLVIHVAGAAAHG